MSIPKVPSPMLGPEIVKKVAFYTSINYLDYAVKAWLFIAQRTEQERVSWMIAETLSGSVVVLRNLVRGDARLLIRRSWYFEVSPTGECKQKEDFTPEYCHMKIFKIEDRISVVSAREKVITQVSKAEKEYQDKLYLLSQYLPVEKLPEEILAMEKEVRPPRASICKWSGKKVCFEVCFYPARYCPDHEP